MRNLIACFFLVLFAGIPAICAAEEDVYRSAALGFSITKPAQWFFESSATSDRVRDIDVGLVEVVSIMKHKEPYPDLNTSLNISCASRDKLVVTLPRTLIKIFINKVQQRYEGAVVEEGPAEVTVAGRGAAYARITFEAKIHGAGPFPVCAELWAFTAGDQFWIVSAESRQDEKTGSRKELHQVLETMKIEVKGAPAAMGTR